MVKVRVLLYLLSQGTVVSHSGLKLIELRSDNAIIFDGLKVVALYSLALPESPSYMPVVCARAQSP